MSKSIKLKDNYYLDSSSVMHNREKLSDFLSRIIESGSNTNGNYIKCLDGTLVQYGAVNLTTGTAAYTSGYTHYGVDTLINLPFPFIDTNYSVLANSNTPIDYISNINANRGSTTAIAIRFQSSQPNYSRLIYWLAIGRWK